MVERDRPGEKEKSEKTVKLDVVGWYVFAGLMCKIERVFCVFCMIWMLSR